MNDPRCLQCGHLLPLETFAARVRCDYCGADNRVERAGVATTARSRTDPVVAVAAALAESDPELRLREIVRRLRRALPEAVETLPVGSNRWTGLRLRVGEYQLELKVEGGRLAGRRARVVRGTVITPVMVDDGSLAALLAKDLDQLAVLERFLD